MKKQWIAIVALFLLGPLAIGDALADRGRHGGRGGHGGYGHSRVGVGVVVGSPFWSPWYSPAPYYYPPYYPPVVIERQVPPVYVEQSPPPVKVRAQAGFWYYCQSPSGYYPEIQECPKGWIKVPPRP
jgi:hypothetical protein